MSSLTMCKGTDCPIRDDCYRYKAVPSEHQSWFAVVPYDKSGCDYYLELDLRIPRKAKDE